MSSARHFAWVVGLVLAVACPLMGGELVLKDVSLDKPLILDENVDYRLSNVSVVGIADGAALTLTGRIRSIDLDRCTFGRAVAGPEGKAAGLECAGAVVDRITARQSTFFDAEIQLASLKDGSFGRVTFERCRFATSEAFLKQIYANNPWRTWPPVTEFYNIDRLELLDNEYSNTTVVIHPSVKQVIIRGTMPGLRVVSQDTQVVRLEPGQVAETVAPPPGGPVAVKVRGGNRAAS